MLGRSSTRPVLFLPVGPGESGPGEKCSLLSGQSSKCSPPVDMLMRPSYSISLDLARFDTFRQVSSLWFFPPGDRGIPRADPHGGPLGGGAAPQPRTPPGPPAEAERGSHRAGPGSTDTTTPHHTTLPTTTPPTTTTTTLPTTPLPTSAGAGRGGPVFPGAPERRRPPRADAPPEITTASGGARADTTDPRGRAHLSFRPSSRRSGARLSAAARLPGGRRQRQAVSSWSAAFEGERRTPTLRPWMWPRSQRGGWLFKPVSNSLPASPAPDVSPVLLICCQRWTGCLPAI